MSHEALPLDAPAFARALDELPVDALHSRAAEIQNSIAHLKSSNEQMIPFAEEGDQDCKDAMFENLVVIGRMNERLDLLRAEVEKRGMRWADAEVEDREASANLTDGTGQLVNGNALASSSTAATSVASEAQAPSRASGTLTDEQLAARLRELQDLQDDGEDEEGVHL